MSLISTGIIGEEEEDEEEVEGEVLLMLIETEGDEGESAGKEEGTIGSISAIGTIPGNTYVAAT